MKKKYLLLRTMIPLLVIWGGMAILFLSFNQSMFHTMWITAIESRITAVSDAVKKLELDGKPLAEWEKMPIPSGYFEMPQGLLVACILFDENGKEILHNNIIRVNKEGQDNIFGYIDGEKLEDEYLTQINNLVSQNKSDANTEIYLDTFCMDGYEIYPMKITVFSQNNCLGSVEFSINSKLANLQEYKGMGQKYKAEDLKFGQDISEMSENLAKARGLSCYSKMKDVKAGENYSSAKGNQLTGYETGIVGKYRYLTYLSWDKRDDMRLAEIMVLVPTFLIFTAAGLIITHQFKKIYEKQLALETYRKETTDALAHDLKTPLAVISGYAQNLSENIHSEKREHYAGAILEEISMMDGIIQKMLKISRLERLKDDFAMTDVNLLTLSQTCTQRFADRLADKQMKIHIQGSGHITANKEWMESIIENLVSNAVKYGKAETTVHIIIGKNSYEVINICQEKLDLEKLWQPYIKSDSARRDRDSSGLGLAIVKRAVMMHGFLTIGEQKDDLVKFGFVFDRKSKKFRT